ncbi:hypothetical protein LPW11_18020 [Geomonas sp. RF6]|uniref:hypothetical protein n=1 Tax=Geomonas sp. RF6 TaxID=2897342 RepID=UPI001E38F8C7|nr:hypothetical protein [Geomonas sp. RF6]UFS69775.1 hypothetical protein LPW11_18020 [Geomonas sp. RF6]
MNVTIISSKDKQEYAVIRYDEWIKLRSLLEELEERFDSQILSAEITTYHDETFGEDDLETALTDEQPSQILADFGRPPVKTTTSSPVAREKRQREKDLSLLNPLAKALKCEVEDLILFR